MGKKCYFCKVDEEDCSSDHESVDENGNSDMKNGKLICSSCYGLDQYKKNPPKIKIPKWSKDY